MALKPETGQAPIPVVKPRVSPQGQIGVTRAKTLITTGPIKGIIRLAGGISVTKTNSLAMVQEQRNKKNVRFFEGLSKEDQKLREEWVKVIRNREIEDEDFQQMRVNVTLTASQALNHQEMKQDKKEGPINLPESYRQYAKVFNMEQSKRLLVRKEWDHEINLKEGSVPDKPKGLYSLTKGEEEKAQEFIQENLKKGYIRPSKSEWASPFFFIGKGDSTEYRPTQDYR